MQLCCFSRSIRKQHGQNIDSHSRRTSDGMCQRETLIGYWLAIAQQHPLPGINVKGTKLTKRFQGGCVRCPHKSLRKLRRNKRDA